MFGDGSLRSLLRSLQRQEDHVRWEALLLVLDNRPFQDLRRIVRSLQDERIWVQAEWINHKYAPKDSNGHWKPDYHNKLYNLTDEAIRACPPDTEWVVITNGDNDYDPGFLKRLVGAGPGYDVVAFDYYSRYQRPTANPCERFRADPGQPMCKENEMRFCQTDLAANAFRWRRFVSENRRFGKVDEGGGSTANDGILASILRTAKWKVKRVRNCMVNHAPSPQQCALQKKVWDDSEMTAQESYGGQCISESEAARKLHTYADAYEVLPINITFDPMSFADQYGGLSVLPLTCLRYRDRARWQGMQVYGRVCTAESDLANVPKEIPEHPWDDWIMPPIKDEL